VRTSRFKRVPNVRSLFSNSRLPKRIPLYALLFLAVFVHPVRGEDFWGRELPDQPSDFIFGYGSLINTASRNSSLIRPVPTIPVRVSAAFGYVRVWNDRAPSGFTALGLRKPVSGESPMTINGVLYPVEGSDMASLDAREQGYVRVEISHADMEAVSWQSLPAKGRIWVYVPDIAGKQPGVDLPSPDAQYPMLESYVDIVIEGALEYGPEFARELIVTTEGWSPYWLNDRELARRPWVFDKQSAAVDKLLIAYAPHFADRLLPGEYTVKYLLHTVPGR
jgi:hypothetical protein